MAQERREFLRIHFKQPVQYKTYSADIKKTQILDATSENVSQSGILFQTESNPPTLSSIVWMNLDMRTLSICKEIERRALIFNNGLPGRVVRVEEDPDNNQLYDIGVCFLTQDQKHSVEIEAIIAAQK